MLTYAILAIQVTAVLLGAGILYISVISKREEIQQKQARREQKGESTTHSVANDSC